LKLTTLISACIRLNYITDAWKTAEVIMIPTPGMNLSEVESYRPVSLLPIMSKLFEKLILKCLKPTTADKHLVPTHRFGFRKKSLDNRPGASCHWQHWKKTLENKGVCLLSFLTSHKHLIEYGIEVYFINRGQIFPTISIYYLNLI
jgi:hypothetical protein